jgi:hypothetical protein
MKVSHKVHIGQEEVQNIIKMYAEKKLTKFGKVLEVDVEENEVVISFEPMEVTNEHE